MSKVRELTPVKGHKLKIIKQMSKKISGYDEYMKNTKTE